jgi:hypothetical protein
MGYLVNNPEHTARYWPGSPLKCFFEANVEYRLCKNPSDGLDSLASSDHYHMGPSPLRLMDSKIQYSYLMRIFTIADLTLSTQSDYNPIEGKQDGANL